MKRMCIFVLMLVIAFAHSAFPQNKQQIVFLYTNSLNGIMDACQCAANPKGSLVKRGYAMTQLRIVSSIDTW